MSASPRSAIGLDFGTESVRAFIVALDGRQLASAVAPYKHGQLTGRLPSGEAIAPDAAYQHPQDWIDSGASAVRAALSEAKVEASSVVGVGVDFTSCTMLPSLRDGTPLCLVDRFARTPHAWPKLWKHHGAKPQTARINELARSRNEPWLARYGGTIGLEWFFPKMLETLDDSPEIFDAAEVWLEAGDWFVWQLVGCDAGAMTRSTCQAGYKAMWSGSGGYPSEDFLAALDPRMRHVVRERMPGVHRSPGERAGGLTEAMADRFGLRAGTAVSTATIDAHAGVPGAGVADADALVMVLGTSSCHMLNSRVERLAPGIAGVVEGGILPGFYGYETGQAAVGDAFDWLRRLVGHNDFSALAAAAAKLPPGADGVACLDWMNGCRTPLMDGTLTGAFTGLTLAHGPGHLYRALVEATAFGVRWIVDVFRGSDVAVNRFVATGGLAHADPLLMQIYADILAAPIEAPAVRQGPALGAAILGAVAAGEHDTGFADVQAAIRAMSMSSEPARAYQPTAAQLDVYAELYQKYRRLAATFSQQLP